MRLHVEHTTTYSYARPVALHRHRLVVRPREGHDLRVERMRLDVAPACPGVAAAELEQVADVAGSKRQIAEQVDTLPGGHANTAQQVP